MAETLARHEKQQAVAGLRKEIGRAKRQLAQRERRLRRLENSLLPAPLNQAQENIDFGYPGDKNEVAVIRTMAERLTEARKLCGYTVQQAAQLLNIVPEDLKTIENTTRVYRVPLWLIKRATEAYSVPADYLFGLIDEFDAGDPEAFRGRNLIAALQRQELENFSKTAAAQINQDNRLMALNSAVAAGVISVQHIVDAFARFTFLNPQFQCMPGGAPVLKKIQDAEEITGHAAGELARYKALPESLMAHVNYMFQKFPEQNGFFPKE